MMVETLQNIIVNDLLKTKTQKTNLQKKIPLIFHNLKNETFLAL